MRNINIFKSLYKYRPRPNRRPLEDFVTESIAYLLSNDKNLLTAYLNMLLKGQVEIDKFEIKTQFSIDVGRIDMVVSWSGNNEFYSLFVEHKVWSSIAEYEEENKENESYEQIDKYCRYQDRMATTKKSKCYVALVSNYPAQGIECHEKKYSSYRGNFTWFDISRVIREHLHTSNDSAENNLKQEFIDFMRGENMSGFDDFTMAELGSIGNYKSFRSKFDALRNQIIQQLYKTDVFSSYNLKRKEAYGEGKIGDFYGVIFHDAASDTACDVGDNSSIWVYFVLADDSRGPGFPTLMYDKIPEVCCGVLKSFNHKEQMEEFQSKYQAEIESLGSKGFDVHKKKDDHGIHHLNLIRRQSLVDFAKKSNQEQEICQYIKNNYNFMLSDPDFAEILRGLSAE